MKLALLLAVIDPNIGGVLIFGHRGTGKSTAVRALADLLPKIHRSRDCPFGCDPASRDQACDECRKASSTGRRRASVRLPVPVVDLPLGATEDRVCGTLDIERALVEGAKAFEPGLLARANRGFLYIDEVNLLEDHLVDVLLDVAASGWNIVEREGISVTHPARFVLVGSGNPEEGELRPQLLDRFGLFTQIETINDLEHRVEIVQRRQRFEQDSMLFVEEFSGRENELRRRLVAARRLLPRVRIEHGLVLKVAELCVTLNVDGHRGELSIVRSARALASLEGRQTVAAKDVQRVSLMSLRHRLRKDPLERIESGARIREALARILDRTSSTPLSAVR
jgi:magnesium chelatase subunit I